jgi:ubiquitin C-terminal hydrolase
MKLNYLILCVGLFVGLHSAEFTPPKLANDSMVGGGSFLDNIKQSFSLLRKVFTQSDRVGNRCFMNASLQSFFTLTKLNNFLIANESYYENGSLAREYTALVKELNSNRPVIDLIPFCVQSWQIMNEDVGTQQDAKLFAGRLLESIKQIDNNKHNSNTIKLLLQDLFDIEIRSFLTTGTTTSENTESQNVLELKVKNDQVTLIDALADFTSIEDLGLYNGIAQTKRLLLDSLPEYLIIGLNRLSYDVKTNSQLKIKQPILFPLEQLNITEFVTERQKDASSKTTYDLSAFVLHIGSGPTSGHYIAYVKHNNKWYLCNDERITAVSENHVYTIATQGYGFNTANLTQAEAISTPVLLFYEKNV